MEMLDVLFEIGRWSLDAVWIPLCVWTVVALPVYGALHATERISPHVRYWTLSALLFALPLGLLAAGLSLWVPGTASGMPVVTLPAAFSITVEASTEVASWTTWHTGGAALVAAAVAALLRVVGLAASVSRLSAFRCNGSEKAPRRLSSAVHAAACELGVRSTIDVRLADTSSPFTFGIVRPTLVLPEVLVERPDDLRVALTHELIHIRRRDYLLQWTEQVVGAIFIAHPLVTLIRRETSILREITCDAEVIAHTGSRTAYARLLYAYSATPSVGHRLAVGIFSPERQLKQRIRAMKDYFDARSIVRSRRQGMTLFAILLAVSVGAVACSDSFVESSDDAAALGKTSAGDSYVVVEEMPQLKGGLESIQKNLRYPEIARKAGVEGRVIVQFVVDEEGRVVDPEVVRGVGSGLDEAALEAVRKASFVPGLQRGEPVSVKMSLPVTFELGNEKESRHGSGDAAASFDSVSPADAVELPKIVGGLESVVERLRYPEVAREAGIEGRVLVSFIVDVDGSVRDARIREGLGSGLDEEALRVVRATSFTPARKNGEPQAVSMTLPITFKLGAMETDSESAATSSGDTILIRLGTDRTVYVNNTQTSISGLQGALNQAGVTNETVISLRVADGVAPELVSDVQEALRAAADHIRYTTDR